MRALLGQRQTQHELGAVSAGFGAQATAVRFRHLPRDVQTEAAAGWLVGRGFDQTHVRLENSFESIGRDAWAVVRHAQLGHGVVRANAHANLASVAVLHRVGQQIEDDLADAVAVAAYANPPGGQVSEYSARWGERTRDFQLLMDNLPQVMIAKLQRQLIGRLCGTGQILHQSGQASDLGADDD